MSTDTTIRQADLYSTQNFTAFVRLSDGALLYRPTAALLWQIIDELLSKDLSWDGAVEYLRRVHGQ